MKPIYACMITSFSLSLSLSLSGGRAYVGQVSSRTSESSWYGKEEWGREMISALLCSGRRRSECLIANKDKGGMGWGTWGSWDYSFKWPGCHTAVVFLPTFKGKFHCEKQIKAVLQEQGTPMILTLCVWKFSQVLGPQCSAKIWDFWIPLIRKFTQPPILSFLNIAHESL